LFSIWIAWREQVGDAVAGEIKIVLSGKGHGEQASELFAVPFYP
jgi:hypothetical protein